MVIEFADPGLNAFPFLVVAILTSAPVLFAGICFLAYIFRSRQKSNLDILAANSMLAALLVGVIGFMFAGGLASATYRNDVDSVLYTELREAGFSAVVIEPVRGQDADKFSALYKGEKFEGTIVDLDYPKDYTYLIEGAAG